MMAFSKRRWGRFTATLLLPIVLILAACGPASPTATPPPPTATATIAARIESTPTVAPTATPTLPPTRPAAPAVATPGTPGASVAPTATPLPPTATATPTPIPPTATPVVVVGLPVRVKIPSIKVDADIEYVGLAPDGAMDVPKNYNNTAWYQLGPRPGDQGNSAIAGHVDSKTGRAVFWDLPKLKPGDEVFVAGDDGVERKFIVTAVESYKRADAPLDRIFGPSTSRHLNLITCDPNSGFNRTTSEYGGNVVVYTELAPGQ